MALVFVVFILLELILACSSTDGSFIIHYDRYFEQHVIKTW